MDVHVKFADSVLNSGRIIERVYAFFIYSYLPHDHDTQAGSLGRKAAPPLSHHIPPSLLEIDEDVNRACLRTH